MNPYLDIIIRSASVYFFMIIALRLFGKNELSQLNNTDVILILLISLQMNYKKPCANMELKISLK